MKDGLLTELMNSAPVVEKMMAGIVTLTHHSKENQNKLCTAGVCEGYNIARVSTVLLDPYITRCMLMHSFFHLEQLSFSCSRKVEGTPRWQRRWIK